MTSLRERWKADMAANRYSSKGRVVMTLFRIGQGLPDGPRRIYRVLYYVLVDMIMGISLPFETEVGGGLCLRHGQGLVVSWRSRIGDNCELHQGVTLGEHREKAPVLRDRVTVGANAVLIGNTVVGDDAYVGAGAVVTKDVPPGAVAIGPAATLTARSART